MKTKRLKNGVTYRKLKNGEEIFYIDRPKIPRKNSLVKFNIKDSEIDKRFRKKIPFNQQDVYIFLGEIVNMQGHCIVMNYKTKEIHTGCHSDYFSEFNPTRKFKL